MSVRRGSVHRIRSKWMQHAPGLWWGDRLDARFIATESVSGLRNQRVLDVGCNAGIVLSELHESNFNVGLDLSIGALKIAKRVTPAARLVRADMLHLPFRDESFDTLIFCGMLEVPPHGQKASAIRELARVLRPGGTVYLTTLNRRYLRYRNFPSSVTYEDLETLLQEQFEAEIRGFNPLPPFPYFLPNAVLARVPGIWWLLGTLMEHRIATRSSCAFLVRAVKRPAGSGVHGR